MPVQPAAHTGDLKVSSKILGHISEGLYRGPAGVFKELVSNAFDANAKTIWISTGRPRFDVVSVWDDGDGMTLDKFKELMSGGIGDSDKRVNGVSLVNGRDVIGRLGIGLLGVSQISHEFSIESHSGLGETAFRAAVWMRDFRRDLLDRYNMIELAEPRNHSSPSEGYTVGAFEAEEIPFQSDRVGMTITATDPTEGFRRQLAEDIPDALPKDFRIFSERSRSKDVLATGPWYDRMVWQLASLAPIQYMSGSAVPAGDGTMHELAKQLTDFNFGVILDGVKLFKPVLLDGPTSEVPSGTRGDGEGPFHFPLELDKTVWGSALKVRGYIHGSAGKALHPDDIRGILIRLKHVGIGEYDKSLLDYRYAEGPRFAWLTGELYVETGLEDALTVGRDGFDIGHPHYIELRKWLHKELRSRIFPTLIRGISFRRLERETVRSESRAQAFGDLIAGFADKPIDIVEVNDTNSPPVCIDLTLGSAKINSAASWPRGKRQRETAQRLSVIFELVRLIKSDRDAIDEFNELTRQLLSRT